MRLWVTRLFRSLTNRDLSQLSLDKGTRTVWVSVSCCAPRSPDDFHNPQPIGGRLSHHKRYSGRLTSRQKSPCHLQQFASHSRSETRWHPLSTPAAPPRLVTILLHHFLTQGEVGSTMHHPHAPWTQWKPTSRPCQVGACTLTAWRASPWTSVHGRRERYRGKVGMRP